MSSFESGTKQTYDVDASLRKLGIVPRNNEDAARFKEMTDRFTTLLEEKWISQTQIEELGRQPIGQTYTLDQVLKIVDYVRATKIAFGKDNDINISVAKRQLSSHDSILEGLKSLKETYSAQLDVSFILDDLT